MSKRKRDVDLVALKATYKEAKRAYFDNPEDEDLKKDYETKRKAYKAVQTTQNSNENEKDEKDEVKSKILKTESPEVDKYRETHRMKLEGPDAESSVFYPYASFTDVTTAISQTLDEKVANRLMKVTAKFKTPTPIQAQCWPIALAGRDLIGIAETGSGKTLGFALPAVAALLKQDASNKKAKPVAYPRILVLSPTRELAMQIQETFQELGKFCSVTSQVVYGGVSKQQQAKALTSDLDVVVGTPGRLLDFLFDESAPPKISLKKVQFLVLDEADRMLDMGFERDVRKIIGECPSVDGRTTFMFSATWPPEIRKLASEFLKKDALRVTIGTDDLVANSRVTQTVEVIEPRDKPKRLEALLKEHHQSRKNRILIFVLYKKEAGDVESALQRKGWKCIAISGDRSQSQRTEALNKFKTGEIPLLIATDVAARGLDIPDVSVVINYSFPLTIEDYIHRIGRTGRAGKTGISHTLFTSLDKQKTGALVNVLREANQPVPEELLAFGCFTKKKEHSMYGAHFKEVDMSKKAAKVTFDSDEE